MNHTANLKRFRLGLKRGGGVHAGCWADSLIALDEERCIGRSYSQDLRQRVVEVAGLTSPRQAAARFWVGIATEIRWMAALTSVGTVATRPPGWARRSKPESAWAFLRGLIDGKVDITLEEMCVRLRDEHDLTVGLGTLWSFLERAIILDDKNT